MVTNGLYITILHSFSISSTGQHLASCSEDKTIRLIKFQPGTGAFVNGSETRKLNGHSGSVNDVKFAPNANFLASASQDKTIRICETATGTCAIVLDEHSVTYAIAALFSSALWTLAYERAMEGRWKFISIREGVEIDYV